MFQDLNVLPSQADVSCRADFLELKALIGPDKNFSKADFREIFNEAGLHDEDDSSDVLDPTEYETQDTKDRLSVKWRDYLSLCRFRDSMFSDSYPFIIPEDEDDILILRKNLSDLHKAYLSLLICSCLRCFDGTHRSLLARGFEKMSYQVFKYCVPPGSVIKGNWANPDQDDNCYTGKLPDRLRKIARDIRCRADLAITDEDYNRGGAGDAGIDLVAWHEMFDGRMGLPIAMGQCGCSTREWRTKQFDSSFDKHKSSFPIVQPWLNFYFCPLDLLESLDRWRFQGYINSAIFVDRFRFISIMRKNNCPIVLDSLEGILNSTTETPQAAQPIDFRRMLTFLKAKINPKCRACS